MSDYVGKSADRIENLLRCTSRKSVYVSRVNCIDVAKLNVGSEDLTHSVLAQLIDPEYSGYGGNDHDAADADYRGSYESISEGMISCAEEICVRLCVQIFLSTGKHLRLRFGLVKFVSEYIKFGGKDFYEIEVMRTYTTPYIGGIDFDDDKVDAICGTSPDEGALGPESGLHPDYYTVLAVLSLWAGTIDEYPYLVDHLPEIGEVWSEFPEYTELLTAYFVDKVDRIGPVSALQAATVDRMVKFVPAFDYEFGGEHDMRDAMSRFSPRVAVFLVLYALQAETTKSNPGVIDVVSAMVGWVLDDPSWDENIGVVLDIVREGDQDYYGKLVAENPFDRFRPAV